MSDQRDVLAIEIRGLSFDYGNEDRKVLSRVNLEFREGEFALICGATGSGKSTLLRTINGLSPHFSGGNIAGSIKIFGEEKLGALPHELADLVGYVNQNSEFGFVAETVEEELAFGMEQLGVARDSMAERIGTLAEVLDLGDLLSRNLTELSGGQQQRVAIAAAVAAGQRVLLLDEPTSALDSAAAHETLLILKRLSRDLGVTVLLVEHRIERVLELVDSVCVVHGDATVSKAEADEVASVLFRDHRMTPPIVELGQLLGWNPLPIRLKDAHERWKSTAAKWSPIEAPISSSIPALTVTDLSVNYGQQVACDSISLELNEGEILGLMGPNGSGKSSLLWAISGFGPKSSGEIVTPLPAREQARAGEQARVGEQAASGTAPETGTQICLVPQQANDLLFLASVSEELAESDSRSGQPAGTTAKRFAQLAGRIDPSLHPRDLSAGQQLALVLSIQLVREANIILLDEPTRGLDYESKRRLAAQLHELTAQGKSVLVASHDVEFMSQIADRLVRLEKGILAEVGSPSELLGCDSANPSQIAQVCQVAGLIRVEQVMAK